jgi:hypothetical protein
MFERMEIIHILKVETKKKWTGPWKIETKRKRTQTDPALIRFIACFNLIWTLESI